MKFDDQLATYLYEHKTIDLEGIGTFTLDNKARVPGEHEKEIYYPIEGLSFVYNSRIATSENVISYLVNKLHKIEPLVRSDIESYLSNVKVLLNIGKPYTIEGIGTLIKNNQGIYEFTPGTFLPVKEELHPKRENADHNYPVRPKYSGGRTAATVLTILISLAAIAGAGYAIFKYAAKPSPVEVNEQPAQADTQGKLIDTGISTANMQPAVGDIADTSSTVIFKGDSATYKMIFEITKSKERAYSRTAQLNDLGSYTTYDTIPINDSVNYYRLFLLMKIAPGDTARVKDSLKIFFGKKIYMEKLAAVKNP